jgi:hypothetical protein
MATKKNTAPVEEQIAETAPVEAMNLVAENEALKAELEALKAERKNAQNTKAEAPAAPKMVKIRIPRTKKDEEDVFVSVNLRTYIIKRGVDVEVPDFVAEVLRHQEEMLEEIMLFDEAAQNKNK